MLGRLQLPVTATGPFCPSEVQGSIDVEPNLSQSAKFLKFLGPGLLVSVGYMDPGNWATDIAAGSRFGFALLSVVVASSLLAILLQYLALKLGIVTEKDLSQLIRLNYGRRANFFLWLIAELAVVACDIAEVLGGALALKLLFGFNISTGVLLTGLDTLFVLSLKGRGFRKIEAIILGLVATIGVSLAIELFLAKPSFSQILGGLIPGKQTLLDKESWYLAIGILGATIMPHNLYLHSSIVRTRRLSLAADQKASAIRFASADSGISLFLALFVNAAILVLAAQVFHFSGHDRVADIQDAHALLSPLVGTSLAGVLFGIALLASGQSSTFTGTIAGQIIMEGHMHWKISCWQRRLITRGLAVLPALLGVMWLGENSVGRLLVFSQVVLSLQLPFAMYPLIRFASSRALMHGFAISTLTKCFAWLSFCLITVANLWLLFQIVY